MPLPQEKTSNQKIVFELLQKLTGQSNVLTIPRLFVELLNGDHGQALFLSQLIYWSDKGSNPNGWFYKTYSEWYQETLLSEYKIRKAIKLLEAEGIIETKIKKANGNPTLHYKIHPNALHNWLLKKLHNRNQSNLSIEPLKTTETITKTTTKITPKTTLKGNLKNSANKGISKENSMQFLDFTEKNPESIFLEDIIPAVEYYMATYKAYTGKKHPNLKESQWLNVTNKILYVKGEYNHEKYMELYELEKIVDKHFVTEYENCDWNINHFVHGDIIKNRFYEECEF